MKRVVDAYARAVRMLVYAFGIVAGGAVAGMMALTCADVAARAFGRPIRGAYDIVCMLGLLSIACALPYTTAVKGHVAIEHFFLMLPRRGRAAVDAVLRLAVMAIFALLARRSLLHGQALRAAGQVTATLQMPMFWMAYVVAAACLAVILIALYHLLRPGRELIKP